MLRVTNINRATKNIVASASYRSDEALYSERTDEKIKFRNHTIKPESMILTPQHAPEWTKDRQRLWNEVDLSMINSSDELYKIMDKVIEEFNKDIEQNSIDENNENLTEDKIN